MVRELSAGKPLQSEKEDEVESEDEAGLYEDDAVIKKWAKLVPPSPPKMLAPELPAVEKKESLTTAQNISRPIPSQLFAPFKPPTMSMTAKHNLPGGHAVAPKVKMLDQLPGQENLNPSRHFGSASFSQPATHKPTPAPLPGAFLSQSTAHAYGSSKPFYHTPAQLYNSMNEYMSDAAQERELRELVESMVDLSEVDTEAVMPEQLKCKLLPHQVQGIQWMKSREEGKKRGGILADDMGLGKTVQTIGLILANRPDSKPKGTLIVLPLTLKQQWANEIEVKVEKGALRVLVHHGTARTKDPKVLEKYDVVITTYEMVGNEWVGPPKEKKVKKNAATNLLPTPSQLQKADDDDSADESEDNSVVKKTKKPKILGPLFEAQFHRVVLDEAHLIKNRNTQKAKACCEIKAKYRWALTGTPIQNSVEDLFSIFKYLGEAAKPMQEWPQFKQKILEPLKANRGKAAMHRLQVILKVLLLRRTKELITLPKREVELIRTAFLDPDEEAFYTALKNRVQIEFNKFARSGDIMSSYMQILTLLLRLRQACSHPSLTQGKTDADALEVGNAGSVTDEEDLDELANAFGSLGMTENADKIAERLTTVATHSTKQKKILQILEDIRKDNPKRKTIIFSQFVTFLELLEPILKEKGYKFLKYIGSMKIEKREEALHKLKTDERYTIILVSLKCGSQGLNLTACSRVILTDLWWNPAIENQAFDRPFCRAHRFGQREDVKIYKLTIENTIEDRLLELQEKKQEIAKAALGQDAAIKKLNKLNSKEIMHLFR